jgi:hypothetical protein
VGFGRSAEEGRCDKKVPNCKGGLRMRKFKLVAMSLLIVATLLATAVTVVVFRPTAAGPAPSQFIYVAKWICNAPVLSTMQFNPNNAESIGLVPGEYKTDINVHNPSFAAFNVTIKKKFVISQPESRFPQGGFVSARGFTAFASVLLGPDAAVFIDCFDIILTFQQQGIFISGAAKGFVLLIAPVSNLNVVAEYSSESFNSTSSCIAPFCGSTGVSLDVVTIAAQQFVP